MDAVTRQSLKYLHLCHPPSSNVLQSRTLPNPSHSIILFKIIFPHKVIGTLHTRLIVISSPSRVFLLDDDSCFSLINIVRLYFKDTKYLGYSSYNPLLIVSRRVSRWRCLVPRIGKPARIFPTICDKSKPSHVPTTRTKQDQADVSQKYTRPRLAGLGGIHI